MKPMTSSISVFLLGCRIFIAANLIVQAGLNLAHARGAAVPSLLGVMEYAMVPGPFLHAITAMLTFCGLWVLFGIRTRVSALVGTLVVVGCAFLGPVHPVPVFSTALQIGAVGLILALLPPLVCGGGKWCLYQRSWGDLL